MGVPPTLWHRWRVALHMIFQPRWRYLSPIRSLVESLRRCWIAELQSRCLSKSLWLCCLTTLSAFELRLRHCLPSGQWYHHYALCDWLHTGRIAHANGVLCISHVFTSQGLSVKTFSRALGIMIDVASGGHTNGPTGALRSLATLPLVTSA